MRLDKDEALKFYTDFFFGEHHFPGEIKPWGEGWSMPAQNNLATFDFNHLTRLVVMAHDRCIRVEVVPKGMNRMVIVLHKRQREGSMYERHPTIEDQILKIREQQQP